MGMTYVTGAVRRSGARGKPQRVRFLVDTGAIYTVLPERTWRRLGLASERAVDFTLADGTTISRGVSECRVEIEGRGATSPVVLGYRDDGPLLGAVTLETLGLMVDPLTRRLLPMRHMLARIAGTNITSTAHVTEPRLPRLPACVRTSSWSRRCPVSVREPGDPQDRLPSDRAAH